MKINKNNLNINSFFDNIYCLNLDRRVDRWQKVVRRFNKNSINVDRFSAAGNGDYEVDESYKELISRYPKFSTRKDKKYIKSKGAMGCLISHIRILKHAKDNNYKKILIFEDDVIFSKNFKNKINNIIDIENWDILYLGASQHSWRSINIGSAEASGYYRANNSCGTFAFGINSSVYDKLISKFSEKLHPVDEYLALFQEDIGSKCFVLYPNIVIADVTDSDIRPSRNQKDHSKKLRWNMEDYDI